MVAEKIAPFRKAQQNILFPVWACASEGRTEVGTIAVVNQGGNDAMSNCAMCTIAAIAGTDSATIARILRVNGQSDDHLARGLGVGGDGQAQQQGVLNQMIHFVEALMKHRGLDVKGYQYGFPGGERQGYKKPYPDQDIHANKSTRDFIRRLGIPDSGDRRIWGALELCHDYRTGKTRGVSRLPGQHGWNNSARSI
jgi:hypothetical protein